MDRFGTSGTMLSLQPRPQAPYSGFGNNHGHIHSLQPVPQLEQEPVMLEDSSLLPTHLTTRLEESTLAVTTQINKETGKCTASKSNTIRRSYGNIQYNMVHCYSF
jgi:hypothetical protein